MAVGNFKQPKNRLESILRIEIKIEAKQKYIYSYKVYTIYMCAMK